ncbi:MAG TPA: AAA family ATPase [Gammaproteobacteria bacterium]|nr:AAA family ATPase [Gammaproteobacteria bacterium]
MTQPSAQDDSRDWLTTLGLEQDPFAPGYRPEFFYAEPSFLQRLDLLTHLLQFSDSLLVVLGEHGAGKTTLLRELSERAGDNWRICVLRGDEVHSLETALRRLAECLGLESLPADAEALPERVMSHCQDLREAMELPVLIIDDAEQVPPSLLRRLAGLAGDPGATVQRLRILLFGAPALEGLLAQAGLAPGLAPFVQTLSVPRFNEVQAATYLMYRLTVAGYAGESPFSSTEVRAIAKASGGLPGPMNALARDALLTHAGQAGLNLGAAGAGRRWPPLVLGGLLVAAGAWWWTVGFDRQSASESVQWAERPLHVPPKPTMGRIEPQDPIPVPEPEPARAPLPEIGVGAETEPEAGDEEGQAVVEPTPLAAAEPDPALDISQAPPAAEAEPELEPEPEPKAEPEPEPEAEPEPEPEAEPEPEPAEATAPEAEEPLPDSAPPGDAPAGQGLDWLRTQPAGRYTLQLLVSRSEDAVRAFVAQHGLEGELAWYHRAQNGEDRYTLLFGSYPSLAAAQAAIARLPARVQRDKPWPRSFASVQAQLSTP